MQRSWQSRWVHASTGAAAGNLSCLRSYAPSTRRGDVSRRQYVSGRILFPVVLNPALGTAPGANRKRQALQGVPAIRAALGAGIEPVGEPKLPAIPFALVG